MFKPCEDKQKLCLSIKVFQASRKTLLAWNRISSVSVDYDKSVRKRWNVSKKSVDEKGW